MNSYLDKYFAGRREAAHQGTHNAAGSNKRSFLNAAGVSPVLNNTRKWQGANGTATNMPTPVSAPIILQVSNGSAGAVSNFDVFGAGLYLNTGVGTWNSDGSWTYRSVTITSITPNVSYQFILSQSLINPFGVAQTVILAASGPASQAQTPCSVNKSDISGNTFGVPIVTPYNTFQQITNQVVNFQNYIIDSATTFRFSSLAATSVVNLWFYPFADVNVSNPLANAPADTAYGNPGTQQQVVTLKN